MTRAFTIVELLAVTAIVGLLAAMLTPVLAQGKGAAHRSVSVSNVRQIALAQFLYMDDFDDAVAINRDCTLLIDGRSDMAPCTPGRVYRGWVDLTVPYVRDYTVFKSPADSVRSVPLPQKARDAEGRSASHGVIWGDRSAGPLGGDYRSSYARNNNWSNNGTYTGRSTQATHPSTLVLIYSFAANSGAGARSEEGTPGSSFTIVRRPEERADPGRCVPYGPTTEQNLRSNFFDNLPRASREHELRLPSSERYAGRGVYGFADGHVKAFPPNRIRGQCGFGSRSGGVESGNDGVHPDFRF